MVQTLRRIGNGSVAEMEWNDALVISMDVHMMLLEFAWNWTGSSSKQASCVEATLEDLSGRSMNNAVSPMLFLR